MLYIVATPIGNLKDITFRAIETLQSCDGIICEDTRNTSILLHHFGVKKTLLVLNDFNENREYPRMVELLKQGQTLVLVSDAGTPLISDPGYKLVRACLEENISVDAIPGPAAFVNALVLSGLPPDKFLFLGYLPEKPGHRMKLLQDLTLIQRSIKVTYIAYVAPHKLIRTLENMQEVYGDIEIVLAKELTKIHQTVKKELVSKWLEIFKKQPPKGEHVLLFNLS